MNYRKRVILIFQVVHLAYLRSPGKHNISEYWFKLFCTSKISHKVKRMISKWLLRKHNVTIILAAIYGAVFTWINYKVDWSLLICEKMSKEMCKLVVCQMHYFRGKNMFVLIYKLYSMLSSLWLPEQCDELSFVYL